LIKLVFLFIIKDIDGITALHLCAFFNCVATCDTLCARRAFVNAKDNQLLTPLFYACKANCPVGKEENVIFLKIISRLLYEH
jgi:ankyrin repeat protein